MKKRYRKTANKYHPDKAPEDKKEEYEEIMKKLNEIWEILQDENKKDEYDKTYYENKEKFKQKNK